MTSTRGGAGRAMASDGTGALAWTTGLPARRLTVAALTPDGVAGEPQILSDGMSGQPVVAAAPGGTAIVAWPAAGGTEVAVRRAGDARFAAPLTLSGESLLDWDASTGRDGELVIAWVTDRGDVRAAVMTAGGALVAPVTLGHGARAVAAGGDGVTWLESGRVRYASLARPGAPAAPAADHRRPRLKVRVLGVRRHRVRFRVTADERVTLTARVRRRVVRATLRPGRARVLRVPAPKGVHRITLALRAADRAGNVATLSRRVRL